jgi:8-oxo-dGTP pyrophosphatase MutT (NUDIX family)
VVAESGEQVLVLLRRNRTGPDGYPEIRLPKGHIEPDEKPAQAALREVGEEAGLSPVGILASLGHQLVEFDWRGYHYARDEFYFLMVILSSTQFRKPEAQFERLWLPWDAALKQLTFEAEREWVERARATYRQNLQNIP